MEDNLYPFVFGTENPNTEKIIEPLIEVAWDFEKDIPIIDHITHDYKYVTENEAIKVQIYKAVRIARYRYQIYSSDYGSEIEDKLVGKKYTKGYTESVAIKDLRDNLNTNKYITNINIIKANFINDEFEAHINVDTVYSKGVDFYV